MALQQKEGDTMKRGHKKKQVLFTQEGNKDEKAMQVIYSQPKSKIKAMQFIGNNKCKSKKIYRGLRDTRTTYPISTY